MQAIIKRPEIPKRAAFVFALVVTTLFSGCKKSDPEPLSQLPAATHTGRNTLGCLVNGQAFIVDMGQSTWNHPLGVDFIPYINTAWQIDGKPDMRHLVLNFNENNLRSTALPFSFQMSDNYPSGAKFLNPIDGTAITGNNEFKTDSVHKGTLTLTHFTGKIAAGTFAFDAVNDSGQLIHITDGRFDISL